MAPVLLCFNETNYDFGFEIVPLFAFCYSAISQNYHYPFHHFPNPDLQQMCRYKILIFLR